jgi:hypothetical protein
MLIYPLRSIYLFIQVKFFFNIFKKKNIFLIFKYFLSELIINKIRFKFNIEIIYIILNLFSKILTDFSLFKRNNLKNFQKIFLI